MDRSGVSFKAHSGQPRREILYYPHKKKSEQSLQISMTWLTDWKKVNRHQAWTSTFECPLHCSFRQLDILIIRRRDDTVSIRQLEEQAGCKPDKHLRQCHSRLLAQCVITPPQMCPKRIRARHELPEKYCNLIFLQTTI